VLEGLAKEFRESQRRSLAQHFFARATNQRLPGGVDICDLAVAGQHDDGVIDALQNVGDLPD